MTSIGGRYTLGNQLGAGGMGEVFRATDTQTGDPVVIKALRATLKNTT